MPHDERLANLRDDLEAELVAAMPGFRIYALPRDHAPFVAPFILVGVSDDIDVTRDFEANRVAYPLNVTLLFKEGWRDPSAPAGHHRETLTEYYVQRIADIVEAWVPDPTKISLIEKLVRRREARLVRMEQEYLYGCGAEVVVTVRDA